MTNKIKSIEEITTDKQKLDSVYELLKEVEMRILIAKSVIESLKRKNKKNGQ